jgi:hypothetical protein
VGELDAFDVDDCEWFIRRWEDQIVALHAKLEEGACNWSVGNRHRRPGTRWPNPCPWARVQR